MPEYVFGMPGYEFGMPGFGFGMPRHGFGMPGYGFGMPRYGFGMPGSCSWIVGSGISCDFCLRGQDLGLRDSDFGLKGQNLELKRPGSWCAMPGYLSQSLTVSQARIWTLKRMGRSRCVLQKYAPPQNKREKKK